MIGTAKFKNTKAFPQGYYFRPYVKTPIYKKQAASTCPLMVTAGLVDYVNKHYRVYFLMDKRRNGKLILIASTKLPVAPRWYLISPNTGGFVTGANIQIVDNNKLPIRRASLAKLPASLASGIRVMLLFSAYLSVMIILDIMKLSCTSMPSRCAPSAVPGAYLSRL